MWAWVSTTASSRGGSTGPSSRFFPLPEPHRSFSYSLDTSLQQHDVRAPEAAAADKQNAHLMLALLQELHQQGTTLVVVTHDEEVAERCTRAVVMRDGRVLSDGPPGERGP